MSTFADDVLLSSCRTSKFSLSLILNLELSRTPTSKSGRLDRYQKRIFNMRVWFILMFYTVGLLYTNSIGFFRIFMYLVSICTEILTDLQGDAMHDFEQCRNRSECSSGSTLLCNYLSARAALYLCNYCYYYHYSS